MNQKPQRLLIAFHDMSLGGIQKKIIDLITYSQQNYPDIKIRISLRRKTGIFLNQIPKNIIISAPNRPIYRFGTIRFLFWMIKEILIFNPTHILTFMDFSAVPTLIASKFLFWKKPVITIGEDILTSKYLTDLYDPKTALIRRRLIQRYYPKAANIIVQTPIQKKDLDRLLNQKTSNVIALPNWLPLDYPPQKKSKPVRDIDILYVGRIAAQKNLNNFVKIVHQLHQTRKNLTVYMIGSGEEDQKIHKIIHSYGLNKVIKKIPQSNNPQKYYLRAKVFLLTSNYEGFPLTIMEAIASGCRPVCRDLPEIKHFFKTNPQDYLFHNESRAITLLNSSIPNSLQNYQNKIIKLQKKNIKKYLDLCLN